MVTDPGFTRASLRWPIRWRLPLLVCTLLLVSLTVLGWYAARELEKALLELTQAQLQSTSKQLVNLLTLSAQQRTEEARRLAARPSLQALGAAPDDAAAQAQVREELAAFFKTNPQALAIEIWTASGKRVFNLTQPKAPAPRTIPPKLGVGPLQSFDKTAFYDLAVPLTPGTPEGDVLMVRRQIMSSGVGNAIGALIGTNFAVELGSRDGAWTDLAALTTPPPTSGPGQVAQYTTPEGQTRLGVGTAIQNTAWMLWVATPRDVALAPKRVFMQRVIPFEIAILILGPAIAWFVAWRITNPLNEFAAAAESIGGGDLTRRVRINKRDEIGRLGAIFNAMATRVEEDHKLLEGRVQERTANLETALATLKNTQEELVRREKLAMLGQLASGVGHELRNPLGVMTNAIYFLEMVQHDAPAVVKEYHGVLRSQIGLSEKIVSDLLDFARIKPPRREPTTLARLVDDQLARVSAVDNVRIVRELPKDLPPLNVDPVQIGQVVLNLFVNAIQAMEAKGGTLTVRGAMDGGRVRLDVIDTGPGVPSDLQEKIFEALFTTKPRGIGLGLAVSRSLTEANDGQLTVRSRQGEGATFSLIVPAAKVLEPVS
jgi:signal transduction histidine kinase